MEQARAHVFNNGCREAILPSHPKHLHRSACRRSLVVIERPHAAAICSMATFGMPKVHEQDEASACRRLRPPSTSPVGIPKQTGAQAVFRAPQDGFGMPKVVRVHRVAMHPEVRERRQAFGMPKAPAPANLIVRHAEHGTVRELACRTSFPFHPRSIRRTHAGRPVEPKFWLIHPFRPLPVCEQEELLPNLGQVDTSSRGPALQRLRTFGLVCRHGAVGTKPALRGLAVSLTWLGTKPQYCPPPVRTGILISSMASDRRF